MNTESLNSAFAVTDRLHFADGPGGLVQAHVRNIHAEALISIYGGQVLEFQPMNDPDPVLFLSESAYYAPGKAIKGGVPVCWPWFGPDPEGEGRPAHGFVRNRRWDMIGVTVLSDGALRLEMGLDANDETRAIWPYDFSLRIAITVGRTLKIELETTNTGDEAFEVTQALHTYFRVGDIHRTRVSGLEDISYIDKMDGGKVKTETDEISITGAVDRIYTDVPEELIIEDVQLERRITIESMGSDTAVVWNPWADTAAKMADLGDSDYERMLCVETANAADDIVDVDPGETICLGAEIAVRRD